MIPPSKEIKPSLGQCLKTKDQCIDIVEVKDQKADEILRKIFNLSEQKKVQSKGLTMKYLQDPHNHDLIQKKHDD